MHVAITQPGVMNYTIYVEKDCHYVCDFQIIFGVGERKIVMKTIPFSKLLLCMTFILYVYLQVLTIFKAVMFTLISPVYQWSVRTPSIHQFKEVY